MHELHRNECWTHGDHFLRLNIHWVAVCNHFSSPLSPYFSLFIYLSRLVWVCSVQVAICRTCFGLQNTKCWVCDVFNGAAYCNLVLTAHSICRTRKHQPTQAHSNITRNPCSGWKLKAKRIGQTVTETTWTPYLVSMKRWMACRLHREVCLCGVNVEVDSGDDDAKAKCLQMFINICFHKINHIFAELYVHVLVHYMTVNRTRTGGTSPKCQKPTDSIFTFVDDNDTTFRYV